MAPHGMPGVAYVQIVTPSATPVTFGLMVRGHRESLGMTQAEFARRCSVTRTYISALENGRKNPTLETQVRLAEALGISLSALVREAEEKR